MTHYDVWEYNLAHKRRDAMNIFIAHRNAHRGAWSGGVAIIKDNDMCLDTYLKRRDNIGIEVEHTVALRAARVITNRSIM